MTRIVHIDELLPLIEDKPEFIVIDKGPYKIIDYVYVDSNTFDHPLLLECRGIKFDQGGRVIARPFEKFFNLGEKLQPHQVDWSLPHDTTLKLDGSMIHTAFDDGGAVVAMTRKGITDVAEKVQDLFFRHDDAHELFAARCMNAGFTPIFEFTSPCNRIVIPYETPMLTLLAVRSMETGGYLSRGDTEHYAAEYHVPVVNTFMPNAEKLIDLARNFTGEEGIVITFDHGLRLKVKAEEYVMKHRAIDDLGSKKKVLAVVFSDAVDDFVPLLGELDRAALLAFRDEVNHQISIMVDAFATFHITYGHLPRKEYAELAKASIRSRSLPVAFAAYDKKDIRDAVIRILSRNQDMIKAEWRGE